MSFSIPVTYELTFILAMAILGGIDAVVAGLLRLLLRRWTSIWWKTLVVHGVALVAMFALIGPLSTAIVQLRYTGVTIGTLVDFSLLLAVADGLRATQRRRLTDPAAKWRFRPWIVMITVALLAVLTARLTVLSDQGKEELSRTSWTNSILAFSYSQSPAREVLAALRRDFPQEGGEIFEAYVERERHAASLKPRQEHLLAPFPMGNVRKRLVRSRWADIARAPDANFTEIAAQLPWITKIFERLPRSCASIAKGGKEIREPGADLPVPANDLRRLGQLYATMLDAARAGIDHPVDRTFADESPEKMDIIFRQTLPASLRDIFWDPVRFAVAKPAEQCAIFVARLQWIATLPPDKLAFLFTFDPSLPNAIGR